MVMEWPLWIDTDLRGSGGGPTQTRPRDKHCSSMLFWGASRVLALMILTVISMGLPFGGCLSFLLWAG